MIEIHFLYSEIVGLQDPPLLTLKMKMREFCYENFAEQFSLNLSKGLLNNLLFGIRPPNLKRQFILISPSNRKLSSNLLITLLV